ncbi:MAG: hypothetical protein JXB49_07565 [Bacteroidales bacterium]|nr:hypothetical protein [Bacteroidales bacterium]
MKTTSYLSIIFVIFLGIISCEKDEKQDADADVKGVWIGTWQGDWEENGTFCSYVDQNNTKINGNVYIRFDLPNDENYNKDFSAELTGKKFRCNLEISFVDITVTGNVENGEEVTGTFNTNISLSGTFSGTKVPVKSLLYKGLLTFREESFFIDKIIYVRPEIWVNNITAHSFYIYDTVGNFKNEVPFEDFTTEMTYDGEYFWCYRFDSDLNKYAFQKLDKSFNTMITFQTDQSFSEGLCYYNGKLYSIDNQNRQVNIYDTEGNITGNIQHSYNTMQSIAIFNNHIFYSAPTGYENLCFIYCMDWSGELVKVFSLDYDYIRSITLGDGKLYCLVERFNDNPGEYSPANADLIEIDLNQF